MRAARVDQNHVEIVKALRDYGAYVVSCAALGKGFPDLLVGYKGHTVLMEIKFKKGKLTEDQLKFHSEWTGGTLCVVTDIEGAITVLKTIEATNDT